MYRQGKPPKSQLTRSHGVLRHHAPIIGRHGLSIVLILLFTATPFVAGVQDRIGHLEDRILAAHNRQRALLNLVPLSWDEGLEFNANQWAEHLAQLGYLVHSRSDPADPSPEGENLWAGTSGYYTVSAMVAL